MNDAAEKQETPQEVPKAPETIKAVIIPLDQYNEIIGGLQHAPKNIADPIMRALVNIQVHDVNIGPREP